MTDIKEYRKIQCPSHGKNVISSLRTNKHLGQAVEIKFNWVYFLKKTMGLEMLKSCLQFLVWPYSWQTLFPQAPVVPRGPWGLRATLCHHRPWGTKRHQASCQLCTRSCHKVFCSSSSDFCGKFHWKGSIQMENVYNIETDPFLIRETVGVEGWSAQNTSTNSA